MGGVPLPPSGAAVLSALEQHAAGSPLELHRIIHSFSRPDPAALPDLLTALTHLSSHLHAQPATARPLRTLIDAALALDVPKLIDPAADTHPLLAAYTALLSNLISVDAAYVDPVLNLVATSFFSAAPALADIVAPSLNTIVSVALATHPRSSALLAAIVCRRFPHPVRPKPDHVSYFRAVFRTLREVRNPHFTRCAITAAVEKLSAIEALVPADIRTGAQDEQMGPALVAEADKLQDVMLEVLRFIDCVAELPNYATAIFRPLLAAYESHVVPVFRTRFTPFVLLHAASHLGSSGVWDVVERFRTSFFDGSVSMRLRERYLEHSAALVIHSPMVSAAQAQNWMFRLATWLNSYVDAVERGALTDSVDTDVHRLFYVGCAVLMTVVSRRHDAVRPEVVARMRLVRVMTSLLSALAVVPADVVDDFVTALSTSAGVDIREATDGHPEIFAPTRTKFGARNQFAYSVQCPELELEEVRQHLTTSMAHRTDAGTASAERPRKRVKILDNREGRPSSANLRILSETMNLEVSS